MGNFIKTQNSFANGEVAPEFYARDNINGLSRLDNMDVLAGGGLTRRCGLVKISDIEYDARLVSFSVSESEDYLLVITGESIHIFLNDTEILELTTPWDANVLPKLQYAQRFDTMIFVHPDYAPVILKKTEEGFELLPFNFARNDSDMTINIPFIKFDDSEGIEITVTTSSYGNNYAIFTTNSDFWTSDSVNSRILLNGKQWRIAEYVSPTKAIAYVGGGYTTPSSSVSDWLESAFSNRRGWPCSITFHQDRLVFGGCRSYTGGVWLSKVGQHTNFDTGTGLDDEAIFITLLSDQRQQICTVVSSDNLQILTSVGEWAISSKPLTPSAVDISQHTSVGSVASRYLPPQKIEGATVFISGNKKDIRELSLDDLSEKYNATDLCALSKHLMTSPIDMAYNEGFRQLYVVMASGNMAVLNHNSSLGISAWGTYSTAGDFKSVAVSDGITYVLVCRNQQYSLEKFSRAVFSDIDTFDFSFTARALPLRTSNHNARQFRIRKIIARVLDTKTMFINGIRVDLPNEIYSETHAGFCGDAGVNLLGTKIGLDEQPWYITSTDSFPATVLSMTIYGSYLV